MKRPGSSTSAKRCCNSGMKGAYCALTSTSGITSVLSLLSLERLVRRPASPEERAAEPRGARDNVVDEAERLVERLPTRPGRPSGRRERKAPEGGAGQREPHVGAEPRP